MTLGEFRALLDRIGALRSQIRRAALGISLGATLVIWIIEGSRRFGRPLGNDSLEQAAVSVSILALTRWLLSYKRRR
jgi:predicted alpha/beta-fold hydrolase